MMRAVILPGLVCVLFLAHASTTNADLVFKAMLDASQVIGNNSTETGTATATFILDDSQQNLSYFIELDGLVLKPNAADRVEFSDIDKIHIHNSPAGSTGPHVLNIFGLPSEDDSQMVVDYSNQTISGIYNDEDAIDPSTGSLFDQNNPATTKLLSNFVDDLLDHQLYIAIHTAGQNGEVAVRGQILAVPEPSSGAIVTTIFVVGLLRRKRANPK